MGFRLFTRHALSPGGVKPWRRWRRFGHPEAFLRVACPWSVEAAHIKRRNPFYRIRAPRRRPRRPLGGARQFPPLASSGVTGKGDRANIQNKGRPGSTAGHGGWQTVGGWGRAGIPYLVFIAHRRAPSSATPNSTSAGPGPICAKSTQDRLNIFNNIRNSGRPAT